MSSKIFNHIKKLVVALAIIVLCSTNVAYGFTIGSNYHKVAQTGDTSPIIEFFSKIFDFFGQLFNSDQEDADTQYDLPDFYKFLEMLYNNGYEGATVAGIRAEAAKLPASAEKTQILSTIQTYELLAGSGNEGFSIGSLIGSLMSLISPLVDGLVGLIGGGSLEADNTVDLNLEVANATAEKFAPGYGVNLHATAYINNKAKDTGNWALVIHPFLMSGKTMANAVGEIYYNKGYNVLAVDLRGFGDSEGTVAMGVLESLDVYDWLVYMNDTDRDFQNKCNAKVTNIIVHGTSLGGATTNFLSGIDKFMPADMQLQSLTSLNVRGLVEDCGYIEMSQFADQSFILSLGVGLTEENFPYYSDASNSLKHCEVPMLVIHGDADTMVDYEANAPEIVKAVNSSTRGGSAELVTIDGGAHALIIMGDNDTYTNAVNKFIEEKCSK